jgi:hypothetical protein
LGKASRGFLNHLSLPWEWVDHLSVREQPVPGWLAGSGFKGGEGCVAAFRPLTRILFAGVNAKKVSGSLELPAVYAFLQGESFSSA